MLVKRVGRLKPRDAISFFKESPELWQKLNGGEEIEVPDEIVKELIGIEVIKAPKKKVPKKEEPVGGEE